MRLKTCVNENIYLPLQTLSYKFSTNYTSKLREEWNLQDVTLF